MINFIEEGEILALTVPGGGVTKGLAYKIGSLVVLATVSVTAAEVVADATIKASFMVTGVAEVVKNTGGGTAWTEGLKIYWDDSAKKFTKTSSANTLVGVATAAAGDSAATGKVRLDGVAR